MIKIWLRLSSGSRTCKGYRHVNKPIATTEVHRIIRNAVRGKYGEKLVLARGDGGRVGKIGEGDYEAQTSRSEMNKSQG